MPYQVPELCDHFCMICCLSVSMAFRPFKNNIITYNTVNKSKIIWQLPNSRCVFFFVCRVAHLRYILRCVREWEQLTLCIWIFIQFREILWNRQYFSFTQSAWSSVCKRCLSIYHLQFFNWCSFEILHRFATKFLYAIDTHPCVKVWSFFFRFRFVFIFGRFHSSSLSIFIINIYQNKTFFLDYFATLTLALMFKSNLNERKFRDSCKYPFDFLLFLRQTK